MGTAIEQFRSKIGHRIVKDALFNWNTIIIVMNKMLRMSNLNVFNSPTLYQAVGHLQFGNKGYLVWHKSEVLQCLHPIASEASK